MTELDGVDFAILMAFASSSLPERQNESVQCQFTGKLRTHAARCVMQELVEPYGRGGASARFVRRIAGVKEDFA